MRFAEIFLRLGTSLVGWMILIAYFLWLAVAGRVGCDADGDQLYRLLLFAAPLASALAFLTSATRPMPEIHDILRWLGLLPAVLLPFALFTIWRFARRVVVEQHAVCGAAEPAGWQLLWPPLQLVAVLVCSVILIRMWSNRRPDSA
jgi:hypothetical protein